MNCGHGIGDIDLFNMSYVEKTFLHHARQEHYKEERLKWKSIIFEIINEVMGGGEKNGE